MLDKKSFCILVKGMIKDYDYTCKLYNALKPFEVYIDLEGQPLVSTTEQLIEENFSEYEREIIFNYIYPVATEREEISVEDLYDRLIKEREENEKNN